MDSSRSPLQAVSRYFKLRSDITSQCEILDFFEENAIFQAIYNGKYLILNLRINHVYDIILCRLGEY